MPASDVPLIDLRGITRQYTLGDQTVQAVAGIDLQIGRGEIDQSVAATAQATGSGSTTSSFAMAIRLVE